MRGGLRWVIGCGLVLALMAGSVVSVAAPVGGDFRISGANAIKGEHQPAVAYNSKANQYLVVWRDERNKTDGSPLFGWDVYARRIGADGKPVGGDVRVTGEKADVLGGPPAVAYNSKANQYLVVWADNRNSATRDWDIYGRRLNAKGETVGGDFRISGRNATSGEISPAVAYNPKANQYLVVWQDGRSEATRGDDIYGRLVGADGKPVGSDFRVSGRKAVRDETSPAVAYNSAANQYLVVWSDSRSWTPRGTDIYGRRVGADGKPVGGDFRVCARGATAHEGSPDLAYNPAANQYLVVWMDERNFDTRNRDIYGRRVSAKGEPVGGDFRISGNKATGNEWNAAVSYNSTANRYLVVWADERNRTARGDDIYGRVVASNGSMVGGDFRVSGSEAIGHEWNPAVAHNPKTNRYLVAWQDTRNLVARGHDIYGRRVAG